MGRLVDTVITILSRSVLHVEIPVPVARMKRVCGNSIETQTQTIRSSWVVVKSRRTFLRDMEPPGFNNHDRAVYTCSSTHFGMGTDGMFQQGIDWTGFGDGLWQQPPVLSGTVFFQSRFACGFRAAVFVRRVWWGAGFGVTLRNAGASCLSGILVFRIFALSGELARETMSESEEGKKESPTDSPDTRMGDEVEEPDLLGGESAPESEDAQPGNEAEPRLELADHTQLLTNFMRNLAFNDGDHGVEELREAFHCLSLEGGAGNAHLKSTGLDINEWVDSYVERIRDHIRRSERSGAPIPTQLQGLDDGTLRQVLKKGLESGDPVAPKTSSSKKGAIVPLPPPPGQKRGKYKKRKKTEAAGSESEGGSKKSVQSGEAGSVLHYEGAKKKVPEDEEGAGAKLEESFPGQRSAEELTGTDQEEDGGEMEMEDSMSPEAETAAKRLCKDDKDPSSTSKGSGKND